jgi:hypothetical protein
MTKTFCDCCGRECGTEALQSTGIVIPYHVIKNAQNREIMHDADEEGNQYSGLERFQLCQRCSNEAHEAMVKAMIARGFLADWQPSEVVQ